MMRVLMTSLLSIAISQPVLAAFELQPLPYPATALQPAIDGQTMTIHHGKHHKAYVDNLNAQIKTYPELDKMSVEQVLAQISKYNPAVRNNAGGHYNHQLFWSLMAPTGQTGEPSAALLERIKADFGSMDEFKKQFNAAATSRFGSGWAWLIVTPQGKLAIGSTANQDNPLMDIAELKGQPILALDVWEHAYYLSYQNKRADYAAAWWSVVNWKMVNQLFAASAPQSSPTGASSEQP